MTLVGYTLVEEELNWFRIYCQKHGKKTELAQFIVDFEKEKVPVGNLKVRVTSWLKSPADPEHHIPDTNRFMIMMRWKDEELKRSKNGKRKRASV